MLQAIAKERPGRAALTRPLRLALQGDWGIANLHRICGWLSAALIDRTAPGTRIAIWNGRGGRDAFEALIAREIDAALVTPAAFARTMFEGRGIFADPRAKSLRALATLPQDDRLVIAVDAGYGLASLDDLRRARPKLTVAAAFDDGVNLVGFATHRLLEAAGMPRAAIEAWGARFVEGEAPWDVIPLATRGEADAVIFEAVMTPYWRDLLKARRMNFLPIPDAVLSDLEARYFWPRGTVPVGRFAGLDAPFETLDFSDFLLLCRGDLEDDVAHLVAACLCEGTEVIEAQYRHIPPADSPLTYPLVPRRMAQTAIPLHPGAERYYRENALL
ncbi:MAG: hypothetical protein KIT16_21700 [Rhodospirillaceae bacterium]|nr:hypothetical protein [Rhodospirillaceae bacterium]